MKSSFHTSVVRTGLLAAAVGVSLCASASAHTPYLLPNAFDAERPRITLQAALTEDDYFNPDIAISAPAYTETLPSGMQAQIKPNAILKDMAVTEAALDEPGTYRFSTGAFVSRTATFAEIDGAWKMVRQARGRPEGGPPRGEGGGPPRGEAAGSPRPGGDGPGPGGGGPPNSVAEADIPAGAKRMQSESVMTVETYVSKGAPTNTALRTTGHDLELKPITHPNAVYVDQGFAFELLIDGKPATNVPFSVYRAGNIYDDRRIALEGKTDTKGAAKVKVAQGGVYLLTTHYPVVARAPGEAPPARTYIYSLTFEVTR